MVCELSKKNAVLRNGFTLRVCVMVAALLLVGLAVMFQSGKFQYLKLLFFFIQFCKTIDCLITFFLQEELRRIKPEPLPCMYN